MRKYLKTLFRAPQQQVQAGLDDYLDKLKAIALDMRAAITAYLNQQVDEFLRFFGQINGLEDHLDTLRRHIEEQIYEQRLLPDTRDDLLGLLESLDKIPNRIQSTMREIQLQKVRIPEGLHSSLTELADRGVQIVQILVQVIHAFLHRPHDVREGVRELSRHEHEGDVIEQQALRLIFDDASLELAEKMQLYGFVERLGSICDMAEDLGDQIMIWAIKRLL